MWGVFTSDGDLLFNTDKYPTPFLFLLEAEAAKECESDNGEFIREVNLIWKEEI
jgi:hypothetical protein